MQGIKNMQKRSLVTMFFLGLATLGIYFVYWFFATRRELVEKGAEIHSAWFSIIPILNVYFLYKYSEAFNKYVSKDNSVINYTLLLILVPGGSEFILQNLINNNQ